MSILDFEKPIVEISKKIEELEKINKEQENLKLNDTISNLYTKLEKLKEKTYANLGPWEKTLISRHQYRFSTLNFLETSVIDFIELHGDRKFSDDPSIIGGLGKLENITFLFIGQQKGRNTKENVYRNFGMPRPEGYRKALRLMKLADNFNIPIINFIDTPGAYPGIDAEKRNQSEAIATNLIEMANLKVPLISILLGEGGSGGALALAITDVTLMMEHSIYSVISPEGCSSILWKSMDNAKEAAKSLKYTAQDLLNLGIISQIIPEPKGGSHLDTSISAKNIRKAILDNYTNLKTRSKKELIESRYLRFRNIGLDYILE